MSLSLTQSNEKHAQREKENDQLKKRLEMVMNTVNAVADTLSKRIEQMALEMTHIQMQQSRKSSIPTQNHAPPPTPQSWGSNTTGQAEAPNTAPSSFRPGAQADVVTGAGFNTTGMQPPSPFGQRNQAPNMNGQYSNVGNSSGPTYLNVSSPGDARWSPLNPESQQGHNTGATWDRTHPNAQFGAWAPGAGSQLRAFDEKEWSVEGKKVSKELKAFDGNLANYDNWRTRVRDHFIGVN